MRGHGGGRCGVCGVFGADDTVDVMNMAMDWPDVLAAVDTAWAEEHASSSESQCCFTSSHSPPEL